MSFFPYTRYLEKQIEELKLEKKELQAQNNKLVEALVPILRKMNDPVPHVTAGDIVEKKKHHEITETPTGARCLCGEIFTGKDPGQLQEAISAHITLKTREMVRGGRKSWPEIKQRVEEAAQSTFTREETQ